MSIKKILIVDDEPLLQRLVGDLLKKEGYHIVIADDGKSALEILEEQPDVNLVLLDVMIPEYDGWTVCKKIRQASKIPIIMLTAKAEESDELFGFQLGADEYITKPFNLNILLARVNAVLRRAEENTIEIKSFPNLLIDNISHTVSVKDQPVELSPKEYELLLYLAENAEKTLSREQILDKVWGYDYFGGLRTVDTHINRLRIKLEGCDEYIHTIRGFGYKFEVVK